MQPRSLFDGLLLAILGTIVYVELVGPSFAWGRVGMLSDVLTNLDPAFYLVFAGIVAVVALMYMFVYLPQKQSKNPTK
jgi:hypothetical protein